MVILSDVQRWVRQLLNDQLSPNGYDEFEYGTDDKFTLSELRPDITTITVFQSGTEIGAGDFTYDATTNRVTLLITPADGENIRIEYSYYEKYSDTELQGYIEGALLYFTEFRYNKLFYINSSNEIVTSNGENPCRSEYNIIALVTAIHIDPDNVNIRTPEFQLSAKQDKSKKDQISETIARFQRYVGEFHFEEIDE